MFLWRREAAFAIGLSAALHLCVAGVLAWVPEPAPLAPPARRLNITVAKVSAAKAIPVVEQKKEEPKPKPPKKKEPKPKPKKKVEKKPKPLPNPLAVREKPIEEVQPEHVQESLAAKRASEERRLAEQLSEKEAIRYESLIAGLIAKQKRYPKIARRRGHEGEGVIELSLLADGTLANLRILKDSGSSVLDKEMLKMVRRAAPFPPFPEHIRKTSIRFAAPIRFKLR